MAFPQSFLDELIARNPIDEVVSQYVTLQRRGGNLFGLCPFHSEKTASFSVAPEKGIYYCFGCHKGGSVINFIMEREGLDYPDAVRFLAKRAGLEVPEDEAYRSTYKKQERLWTLCRDAARFFHSALGTPQGQEARNYLTKRGVSAQIVTKFGLGFAPNSWSTLLDAMVKKGYEKQELLEAGLVLTNQEKGTFYDRFRNRLMFPILDLRGNVIGFGGRVMDDSTPKYLNSPETLIFNKRKNLFALNLARKSKMGRIILTEGYMDAISLYQFGFDCAVASLGTSLTEEHANLLAKYTEQVVITYDGDAAGQNATKRAIGLLEKTGVQVKILRMQGAKDPDEFLKKFGADRFKVLLDRSENRVEYQLLTIKSKYHLDVDEDKVQFLKEAADLIASLYSPVEREVYSVRAAEAAKVTPEAMKLEVNKAVKRRMAFAKKAEEKKVLAPAEALQPRSRSFHYENIRSARAEESVLQQVLKENTLFEELKDLSVTDFSSPLLGRAYQCLKNRYEQGLLCSMAALSDAFSKEEMEHLTAVAAKGGSLVSEEALRDCKRTILQEAELRSVKSEADLLAIRDRMKEKKGGFG